MRIAFQAFQIHKQGNSSQDCEDAYAVSHYRDQQPRPYFRCAVADGATESAFSDIWAKGLVKMYCQFPQLAIPTINQVIDATERLSKQWRDQVWAQPLPWFTMEKAQKGAFATLLAVQFSDNTLTTGGAWAATVVGDSCLFQLRDGHLLQSFPYTRSEQFNSYPALVSSDSRRNRYIYESANCEASGDWLTGDRFLLMTDAIAHWTFAQLEANHVPWLNEFAPPRLRDKHQMSDWIQKEREARQMKNDDVTLLSISLEKDL